MERAMKRILCIALIIVAFGLMAQAQEAKVEKTVKEYIADLSSGADEKTIIEAEQWLGNKKEKEAVPGLINLLNDKRETVRMEAAIALGLIGEESAADALNNSLLNDSSAEVRYAALLATMRVGSKKSVEAYKQAKERDTDPFIQDLLGKIEAKAKSK
jgi:HEAT repeat protein